MGRRIDFTSPWIVDRKFYNGATWVLRFTACGNPSCRRCGGTEPAHGPYWASYTEIDGRNHLKHHRVNDPLPWGDDEPPSILPSDADPESRRSKQRAARAARLTALVEVLDDAATRRSKRKAVRKTGKKATSKRSSRRRR